MSRVDRMRGMGRTNRMRGLDRVQRVRELNRVHWVHGVRGVESGPRRVSPDVGRWRLMPGP